MEHEAEANANICETCFTFELHRFTECPKRVEKISLKPVRTVLLLVITTIVSVLPSLATKMLPCKFFQLPSQKHYFDKKIFKKFSESLCTRF